MKTRLCLLTYVQEDEWQQPCCKHIDRNCRPTRYY